MSLLLRPIDYESVTEFGPEKKKKKVECTVLSLIEVMSMTCLKLPQ